MVTLFLQSNVLSETRDIHRLRQRSRGVNSVVLATGERMSAQEEAESEDPLRGMGLQKKGENDVSVNDEGFSMQSSVYVCACHV